MSVVRVLDSADDDGNDDGGDDDCWWCCGAVWLAAVRWLCGGADVDGEWEETGFAMLMVVCGIWLSDSPLLLCVFSFSTLKFKLCSQSTL